MYPNHPGLVYVPGVFSAGVVAEVLGVHSGLLPLPRPREAITRPGLLIHQVLLNIGQNTLPP